MIGYRTHLIGLSAVATLMWGISSAVAGYEEGLSAQLRGDFEKAANEYRIAAQDGVAQAQNNLALLYYIGKGVRQDFIRAREWWRQAAEQGHPQAQVSLGYLYTIGIGVPRDPTTGRRWFDRAAAQNYPLAQYNLGYIYESGTGIARDMGQAARWYQRAADRGDGPALYRLGILYLKGEGVAQNVDTGRDLISRAAKAGVADASVTLEALARGVPAAVAAARQIAPSQSDISAATMLDRSPAPVQTPSRTSTRPYEPIGEMAATPAPPAPAVEIGPAQEAAPALNATPTIAAEKSGRFAVQLGSYRNRAYAESSWGSLSARYVALLGGYEPTIQRADLGERGTFYRLQVRAFESRRDAKAMCKALETEGASCYVPPS